jgi:septum formation protein
MLARTPREDHWQGPRLVLASASPRRADLLRTAGIEFDVISADIDEAIVQGETAEEYVCRVARRKVEAVGLLAPGKPILGADTIVVVDATVLGKPVDDADARRMLGLLSGRIHTVITGVCLVNPAADEGQAQVCVGRTRVELAQLSQAEIVWYAASGEPADKAGAYAIQGLASRFVTRIDGSYSNVVGLPVALVYNLCRNAGVLIS